MFVKVTKRRTSSLPQRRVPQQERSKKRYEAVVDAAAEEFARVGFEAATMDAVAARAGTSIGSLYTFFPDKLALFEALAQRTLDRSRAAFEVIAAAGALDRPWTEILDGAIDAFAAFQSDPTFRAVWMNMQLYGTFAEADVELHRSFVERTERIITRAAPRLAKATRRLVATMVVQTISTLLYVAARRPPAEARRMLGETRLMLRRYLEVYLPRR